MIKKIFFSLLAGILLSACTANNQLSVTLPTSTPTMSPTPTNSITKPVTAVIKTNKGTIKVILHPEWAPNTVQNFVDLARGEKINPVTGKKVSDKPFYDGVIFHRVISGFMIQGGDPDGTGRGGPGYKFADEKVTEKYTRGTMAMANSGPNTNGSQFFIMHKDYPLQPLYTIFGRIDSTEADSFATVDAIATTKTDDDDAPLDKVIIEKVTIEE